MPNSILKVVFCVICSYIVKATAANNVDPDQTSDQDLLCLPIIAEMCMFVLGHFSRQHLVYIFLGMLRVSYLEYLLVCITLQDFIFELIQCIYSYPIL